MSGFADYTYISSLFCDSRQLSKHDGIKYSLVCTPHENRHLSRHGICTRLSIREYSPASSVPIVFAQMISPLIIEKKSSRNKLERGFREKAVKLSRDLKEKNQRDGDEDEKIKQLSITGYNYDI